jgi:hypothetical protein
MIRLIVRRLFAPCLAGAALTVIAPSSTRAAEGELRWGLHLTLETEAFNAPFMILDAVHDALVKPMPAGPMTPSLAESRTEAETAPMEDLTSRR